jgi:pyrimidine-nucleoside phosphorylase
MNIAQIIADKRDGLELAREQIEFLIKGYAAHEVPDYQMAAFAMAVYFQNMTAVETETLTRCMVETGERLQWSGKPAVGKHSTGGIGDKISISLVPLLACCGVQVPKISGRGLGATGGTLDKLEAIPGFRCELSNDEFRSIVNWNGCSIASASVNLAPADKRLYALRDVTATVASVPLITASILSKKVAEGVSALILDVKWGSGAFMKTLDSARELAQSLVRVGNRLGVKTSAVITDMNQPLGHMIGHAVEINESIDVLRGDGPADVVELTLELGGRLLVAVDIASNLTAAKAMLMGKIDSGEALEKLGEMVKSQGGDLDRERIVAPQRVVTVDESGFVSRINAERLGLAIIEMGGGRKKLGDQLDHSTGIEFLVRLGDRVESGQPIANVFCHPGHASYATSLVGAAVGVSPAPVEPPVLIVESFS